MSTKNKVRTHFELPAATHRKLKILSAQTGKPMVTVITELVDDASHHNPRIYTEGDHTTKVNGQ